MQGQIGITDCKTRRLISTHVRVRAAQSEDLGADALRALTITTPAGARGEENQEVCVGVAATCVVTLVSGYHHHPCSLLPAVHTCTCSIWTRSCCEEDSSRGCSCAATCGSTSTTHSTELAWLQPLICGVILHIALM